MNSLPLPLVTPDDVSADVRRALDPGATLFDASGRPHRLPTAFLRIESWEEAKETQLTRHFLLWELIGVDVREASALRGFPRYVPCALFLLATALEVFRLEVGTYVHIAANGGYRSPGHALSRNASRHCWGTAANIYRIGDTYLENRSDIEKYAAVARRMLPGVWIRPYGPGDGEADDHLHLDLGYTVFDPPVQDEKVTT
jgi:hypothetical protein